MRPRRRGTRGAPWWSERVLSDTSHLRMRPLRYGCARVARLRHTAYNRHATPGVRSAGESGAPAAARVAGARATTHDARPRALCRAHRPPIPYLRLVQISESSDAGVRGRDAGTPFPLPSGFRPRSLPLRSGSRRTRRSAPSPPSAARRDRERRPGPPPRRRRPPATRREFRGGVGVSSRLTPLERECHDTLLSLDILIGRDEHRSSIRLALKRARRRRGSAAAPATTTLALCSTADRVRVDGLRRRERWNMHINGIAASGASVRVGTRTININTQT